jgi:hypothetical protein
MAQSPAGGMAPSKQSWARARSQRDATAARCDVPEQMVALERLHMFPAPQWIWL